MHLDLQLHLLRVVIARRRRVVDRHINFTLGRNIVKTRRIHSTIAIAMSWPGRTGHIVGSGTRIIPAAVAGVTCGEITSGVIWGGGSFRIGDPVLRERVNWRFYRGRNIFTSLKEKEIKFDCYTMQKSRCSDFINYKGKLFRIWKINWWSIITSISKNQQWVLQYH